MAGYRARDRWRSCAIPSGRCTCSASATSCRRRARLVRIEPRRVVLEHEGELQAVLLAEDSSGAAPAIDAPRPT
jgi:hypothetical protein